MLGLATKHITHYKPISLLFLLLFLPSFANGQATDTTRDLSKKIPLVFDIAKKKVRQSINDLPPNRYPISTTSSGYWKVTTEGGWTSGFFPGILWLLYEQSGGVDFKHEAIRRQSYLSNQQFNKKTHDVGFVIYNSFGNGYRLITNSRYRSILLRTAESLSSRFNKKVGLFKSWEGPAGVQRTIIDNLMNLEILFWSSKQSGNSYHKKIASNHALTTARDFVRADGSTYHLINYNPLTGKIMSKTSAQGLSPQSSWARGQAWAIYGFTIAYRETGNRVFLDTARRTADYFIKNLPPDFVPYWDFSVTDTRKAPKDSSAAAIAASGLLELAKLEISQPLEKHYMATAGKILDSLSSNKYLSSSPTNRSILLHGTYNNNIGDYDTGTIWGDYYFLEALLKYAQITGSSQSR